MLASLAKALVCAALSQTASPSAPADVIYSNARAQKVEANFPESRKAEIRELLLYASQDQGETWFQVSRMGPEQRDFTFSVPVDGAFWLRVAVVNRAGRQEPENLFKVQPNWKLVIDTMKPLVKIASATRQGSEVNLAWDIREDHPEWSAFRIEYTTGPGAVPTPVTAAPGLTGVARFTPNTNGPISVRVVLRDKAGNETIATADVAGREGVTSAPFAAPVPPPSALPPSVVPPLPVAASPIAPPPPAEIPTALAQAQLPSVPTAVSTAMPPSYPDVVSTSPTLPLPVENTGTSIPGNPQANNYPATTTKKTFAASETPKAPPTQLAPVGSSRWTPPGQPTPPPAPAVVERSIASTEQTIQQVQYQPTPPPAPAAPRRPLPTLQYVNSSEVVLEYELSKVGPSGVGSVDIYLTRDDGQQWEHVVSDPAVIGKTTGGRHQGILELPGDGIYGFTLVVKSQAQIKNEMSNLDKKAKGPRDGDTPEIRVEIDTVPPTAELFAPRRDTNKTNSLMLVWTANDKNLGSNPITLEWAERREGPWFPIAANIPNSGKHSWQLPDRLPVQVYMRLRARDLAGNEGIAVTPDPQLVDLSEPEGRLVNVTVPPRSPR